ncbi:hypothetical protein [Bradyrhizobium sp. sBnM-33]|uniref:hypothetical protein n=1 Tax=Bradyrhizobium sp. sBnM-33 TaxID=2831780 RepID=UPI001BCB2DB2|nr:hypothetical protein [Bradyrhizobium sp. sBnM-33]WOH47958.1 hypothetical protein RX328_27880 [Bradyrhizobium sp. sBnM-33]
MDDVTLAIAFLGFFLIAKLETTSATILPPSPQVVILLSGRSRAGMLRANSNLVCRPRRGSRFKQLARLVGRAGSVVRS